MGKKKWVSMLLAVVLVLSLVSATGFAAENEEGWVTGNGYGSITDNADGTQTFQGEAQLNSDNSHCGPYTRAGATSIQDGAIEDSVDVFIDPGVMTVGEKFTITVAINDANGDYKTELAVQFWKDHDGSVDVAAGMAPDFTAKLTKAGIYTLRYRYFDKADELFARFSMELSGQTVADTGDIDMKVATAVCGTRRYIWFSDISVAGGLRVGRPKLPDPLPEEQEAPVLLPEDWVSGEGYGSVEKKSDNLAVLKGDPQLNSDAKHSGPYVNTKGGLLEEGIVVDEVNVFIDPESLTVGEKFSLTASLNDQNDAYLTEFAVNFWKDYDGGVTVKAGLDPAFEAGLTKAGLYTLRYEFLKGDAFVFGKFSIWLDGRKVAETDDVIMSNADYGVVSAEVAKGRRALWFCDISVEDGLQVYSVAAADYSKVDEALAKIPADLSGYTEESVKALNEAKAAVIRGKSVLEQETVDGYAAAIEAAITGLEKKPAVSSETTGSSEPAESTPDSSIPDASKPAPSETDSNQPDTGDHSPLFMLVGLMAAAGGVLALQAVRSKKANKAK